MQVIGDLSAAILAGGLGTRLRPVVADRPKVLAKISGRPFLSYLLNQIEPTGIRYAVLCTGYMGEQVQEVFGKSFGHLKLRYSRESSPLGTAGALRLALPLLASETVLILNGDSFCQFELDSFWAWHRDRDAEATLLLTHVSNTARYGRVHVDNNGRILSFEEKNGNDGPGWISAGVYLIERQLLDGIPVNREVSVEREMFPAWCKAGIVYGCRSGGGFLDIGTPESLAQAERFFTSTVST